MKYLLSLFWEVIQRNANYIRRMSSHLHKYFWEAVYFTVRCDDQEALMEREHGPVSLCLCFRVRPKTHSIFFFLTT